MLLVSSERLGKHLRLGTASIVNGRAKTARVLSAAGGSAVPLGVASLLFPSFEPCTEVHLARWTDRISRLQTDREQSPRSRIRLPSAQHAQPLFLTELLILAVSRRPHPMTAALFED